MPLSEAVVNKLLKEGDIVALRFRALTRGYEPTAWFFRIDSVERPNNLKDFSLGAADAMASAGTGWSTVTNSSGVRWLEPGSPLVLYQLFYGVTPSQAWVYRQYQSGEDRGSLIQTRQIGQPVGFVSGVDSSYSWPSPETEMFIVNGVYPAFNGYHPYGEPASITVFMNFFVSAYGLTDLNPLVKDAEGLNKQTPEAVKIRQAARYYTMGGRTLMDPPNWLQGGRPDRQ